MKQLFIFALCVFIACPALSSEKNDVSFLLEDVKNNSDTATSEENDKIVYFRFLILVQSIKKTFSQKRILLLPPKDWQTKEMLMRNCF